MPASFNGVNIPKWVSGVEYSAANVNGAALGYTHVFSPTFFAESVYNMTWFGENTWAGPVGNTDFESKLGLPNNFGESGFPIIEGSSTTAGNVADIFQPFDGTLFNYSVTYTDYTGNENLTKILGRHQLQFGGRYMFEHLGSLPDRSHDSMEFDGLATGELNASSYSASAANAASNTGNANADEFLGGAFEYEPYLQTPYQHLHDMETDAYFQDNWHARNNLTVNLGLRWESHPAVWQGQGAMMSFDIKNDALVTSGSLAQLEAEGLTTAAIITNMQNDGVKFETPSQAGLPPMLVKSYNLNFLPRVGLAWQPFGKWGTVLRGGFGRYAYPVPALGLAEDFSGIEGLDLGKDRLPLLHGVGQPMQQDAPFVGRHRRPSQNPKKPWPLHEPPDRHHRVALRRPWPAVPWSRGRGWSRFRH